MVTYIYVAYVNIKTMICKNLSSSLYIYFAQDIRSVCDLLILSYSMSRIVYTWFEMVDFQCKSVEWELKMYVYLDVQVAEILFQSNSVHYFILAWGMRHELHSLSGIW